MGTEMIAIRELLASCPPVYTLPGTWTKCNAIIPHYNADPNITLGISIAVITVIFILYGIYRGFFANEGLEDPFDDHDD
jgi:F0F1-type ATP synthase membrane subunit a|tara:strand:+ start:28988 stop:29224 length:237 start_codon:yes stop_codon:yes gene_type:complete